MKKKSAYYRQQAKEHLAGQWGKNAAITLLNTVLILMIAMLPGYVGRSVVIRWLLDIFILFAFTYGLSYVALQVSRGERAVAEHLLVVFQRSYYLPMFVIDLLKSVMAGVIGLLLFLPLLFQTGIFTYLRLLKDPTLADLNSLLPAGVALSTLVFALILELVTLLVMMLVNGWINFTVYLKFDFPEWTVGKVLKKAGALFSRRWIRYLLLQISFIGWALLSLLTLGIGLLFLVPYMNVANAVFYEEARRENGEDEVQWS